MSASGAGQEHNINLLVNMETAIKKLVKLLFLVINPLLTLPSSTSLKHRSLTFEKKHSEIDEISQSQTT